MMIEVYGIELMQMMETAGRNLAHLARVRFLDSDPRRKKVVVAAGTGGNGGGAMVCARCLSNWGADVWVVLTRPDAGYTQIPAHQLGILRRMKLPIAQAEGISAIDSGGQLDLIVDGVIGYSLQGEPRGGAAELIRWISRQDAAVLALDTPSGLDITSGVAFEPAVRATATMALGLPKQGLRVADTADYVGELYLADIGVPPSLYAEPSLGILVDALFAESDIVRIA